MMKKLSIIMPVKNTTYLTEALSSISDAEMRNIDFELILIAENPEFDCDVKKMIENLGAQVLTAPASFNLPRSLNLALNAARGEYVARCDADDLNCPRRFLQQIEMLNSHPDVVVVGGQSIAIDERGHHLRAIPYPVEFSSVDFLLDYGSYLPHPGVMYRRKVALDIGGYEASFDYAEDWDFWLRMRRQGHLVNLKDVVIKVREHSSQKSRIDLAKQEQFEFNAISNEHLRSINANPNRKSYHTRHFNFSSRILRIRQARRRFHSNPFKSSIAVALGIFNLLRVYPLKSSRFALLFLMSKKQTLGYRKWI